MMTSGIMRHASALLAAAAIGALLTGAAKAEDTTVKLGVLNDMSGVYADISGPGSVVAAQMAADDFMAKNKGFKIEVVGADHQNKPDVGASIARKWYDQENVDAILDVTTSSVALAVSDITKEKNKIFLVSGGGTSDLTGAKCSPNTVHWTYDTWALANGTGSALTKQGGSPWFFITADYAFGAALERDASAAVKAAGGKVAGSVKHPLSNTDFSSFLLQAQSSGAKVIGLANAGNDLITAVKQASEFGITQGGQQLAGLLIFSSDVKALGLQAAQGLVLTDAFYWDLNDDTRAFSKRFGAKFNGKMPTSAQAGVYSSAMHYLNAIKDAKTKDAPKVMEQMRATPINDPLFGKGEIRIDGRAIHPMYLLKVKKPADSKGEWDLFEVVSTIPANEAFRPLKDGNCPLVK
ncbi:branched-chain amino acid transport system substrate-binding protein [Xanthobacter flavus]|uniref:Branched-chain amino acid transport system substrate-binding protein n=2 Tax=Xanthobacter flavus TaxID=281 RepID=A0ABU1KL36_XANFL|nr:ABC transporter substrate-binding protein [Xanthobacter flavus]MDR6335309.1 branched-chain amino acid transport system substrate-binding protein [Xanthobacter flavus]